MPPKRKTVNSTPGNTTPKSAQPAKKPKTSAGKRADVATERSNLSPNPGYQNLQWPNIGDFIDDEEQDMPKEGELLDSWCDRVSDMGIPVSDHGVIMMEKLSDEAEKRNQDARDIYICNDWNGWGISEVMQNLLKDFDRDVLKRAVSPYQKWAYVEAFACFTKVEDNCMAEWMGNEDGDGVRALVNMIGLMVLTCFAMLNKHDLLKLESDIKNIPIITLLLLEFLGGDACDLDCSWGCEIVRLCDEAGIELEKHTRKQVAMTGKDVKVLREAYLEKRNATFLDDEDDGDGNGYHAYARKADWTPEDDESENGRMWFRWDWKTEYNNYKKEHKGGTHYDLTKMTKAQMKQYK